MDRETNATRPCCEMLDGYNGWYVTRYDQTAQNTSEVLVFTLVTVAGIEPTELRPLNDTVDPDALDDLFAPTIDGRPRSTGRVTFTHDGYAVVVTYDGEVRVRSVTDAASGSAAEAASGIDD